MHTNVTGKKKKKHQEILRVVVTRLTPPSRLGSDTSCPQAPTRPPLQNTNENRNPGSRSTWFIVLHTRITEAIAGEEILVSQAPTTVQ